MVGVRLPTHNTLKTNKMTKEQFLNKWHFTGHCLILKDLEAVIATEIAKAQEANPQPENLKGNCTTFDMSRLVDQVQPDINLIEEAYERGEKIRRKNWCITHWVQKHNETKTIDNLGFINSVFSFGFIQHPQLWELYTEPTEQPSSQAKLDNSFDRDRFERMFCSVVANGGHELCHKEAIELTEQALAQLDAYYATKEGGNNGI